MSCIISMCPECKHYYQKNGIECCKAFPEGIPTNMIFSQDEEKICNNGIKFEPEEENEAKES